MNFKEWFADFQRHKQFPPSIEKSHKYIAKVAYHTALEHAASIARGHAESQRFLALGMDDADIVAYRIAKDIEAAKVENVV